MRILAHTSDGLCHPVDLSVPGLPATAQGLTIAHVSDLHLGWRWDRRVAIEREVQALEGVDLFLLTGDYMNRPGDEPEAEAVMRRLVKAMRPKVGVFGVFGNHDTPLFRQKLADLPIHWLNNQGYRVDTPAMQVMGFAADRYEDPDSVALLMNMERQSWNYQAIKPRGLEPALGGSGAGKKEPAGRPVRLLLSHYPMYLPVAADMGVDIMFSGHTHGGQFRLPWRQVIYNSSDLPGRLTSGIMRHGSTTCVVSRGLGESWIPLRIFCPAHLPVYTLKAAPALNAPMSHVENVHPW